MVSLATIRVLCRIFTMKYFPLCLLALIVTLPGCLRKKAATPSTVVATSKNVDKKGARKRVYDEELGAFVLEDDADFDVFNQPAENTKSVAEANDELAWEQIEAANEDVEVINFNYDSTEILPTEQPKIAKNASYIKQELAKKPQANVAVSGHSCKLAKSEMYNNNIAQRRAEKLAKEYQKQGVPATKIKAVGRGATQPVETRDGETFQKVNRRAETSVVVA